MGVAVGGLEHLQKEFERVHDAMPPLDRRITVLEAWQSSHPDTHRLEGIALGVAKEATDKRLESMNELRKQIDTERGTFVTRELYDREHLRLRDDITNLSKSRDTSAGSAGLLDKIWPWILACLTFLAGKYLLR
jgi:hypothetical protein